MPEVTLQISLAPSDFKHAQYILPHQLECLANQVDEVLLTIDTRKSKGRFGEGWEEQNEKLYQFLEKLKVTFPQIAILPVDYSTEVKRAVSEYFFENDIIPDKDFRGGPFYAYFFGLYKAKNNMVFHLDSDIFLGGRSSNWISDAINLLNTDPENIFIISPLPGPPHPEDILINQPVIKKLSSGCFEISGMSTRLFMIDRSKFSKYKLNLSKPNLRNQIKAVVEGNSNADLPEYLISDYMKIHQLRRIDFLGTGPGLWSLHPPYRTTGFYEKLPEIIRSVEEGKLPDEQAGFYDVIDNVCDWTEARERIKNNRWWKRLLKFK